MFIRVAIGGLLLTGIQSALAEDACTRLQGLSLPHTSVVSATTLPAGAVAPPATFGPATPISTPARCEVQAITRPSKDSEIRLTVWMPVSSWNGKYLQVGNGGWAGSIDPSGLAEPLRRGYAVAATDDGHQSTGPVPGRRGPWATRRS